MRDSDAELWYRKQKIGFNHKMLWFVDKKGAKIRAKSAQFYAPFSTKNTDAEAGFLDLALKMIPYYFLL